MGSGLEREGDCQTKYDIPPTPSSSLPIHRAFICKDDIYIQYVRSAKSCHRGSLGQMYSAHSRLEPQPQPRFIAAPMIQWKRCHVQYIRLILASNRQNEESPKYSDKITVSILQYITSVCELQSLVRMLGSQRDIYFLNLSKWSWMSWARRVAWVLRLVLVLQKLSSRQSTANIFSAEMVQR